MRRPNYPGTKANQDDQKWRWEIHPYIDGCGDYPPLHPVGGDPRGDIHWVDVGDAVGRRTERRSTPRAATR
jgi:hypothetical protein